MKHRLNVLMVEDSTDDAKLIVRELTRGGYDVTHQVVTTDAEMRSALGQHSWDIVLSDYSLPHFSGSAALRVLRQLDTDAPFIFVSGEIGEETAVAAMRSGAQDYVMKDSLARLVPAVERELRDAAVRRDARRADIALRESEHKYRHLFESLSDAAFLMDEASGRIIDTNAQAEILLGRPRNEIVGLHHTRLYPGTESRSPWQAVPNENHAPRAPSEAEVVRKDGTTVAVTVSRSEVELHGRPLILALFRDATERKLAEESLRRVLRHARTLIMRSLVTAPPEWDRHPVEWSAPHYVWESHFQDEAAAQEVMPLELRPGDDYYAGWIRAKHPADQVPMALTAARAFISGASTWQQEFRATDRHGRLHWFTQVGSVKPIAPGKWQVMTINTDITDRKAAEEAVLAREREFRTLAEHTPDFIVRWDRQLRRRYVNPAFAAALDTPANQLIGESFGANYPEANNHNDQNAIRAIHDTIEQVFATAQAAERELPWETAAGKSVFQIEFVPEFESDGSPATVLGIGRDITRLKEAERQLLALTENSPDIIIRFDRESRYLHANSAAEKAGGVPVTELLGTRFGEVAARAMNIPIGPEFLQMRQLVEQVFTTGQSVETEISLPLLTGPHAFNVRLIPECDDAQRVTSVLSIARDITDRKRAQESLTLFRALLDRTIDGIEVIDPETGRFLDLNERTCQIHGYNRAEFLALTVRDIETLLTTAPAETWPNVVDELRRKGFKRLEGIHRRKDGSMFPVEVNANYIRLDRDYVVSIVRDVTERQRAEEALRESEQRFRQVTENIDEVFWLTDVAKNEMIYVSPAYHRIWGRTCESLYTNPQSWLEAIHEEDRERVRAALAQQSAGAYDIEYRIVCPDGSIRWIHDRAFPILNNERQPYRVAGVAEDITVRRQLEEQFRQAQKMEAIGQLAGGIAHDFNNLLTVIQMQTSLLLADARHYPGVESGVQPVMDATRRAADLTRQLLTFSRRDLKEARDLDVSEVIGTMIKLVRRILGEDISLETRFASDLPWVHADPGMLEQVLMNLLVNARDAMPRGGRLLLSLDRVIIDDEYVARHADARRGHHVCLVVTDTGSGIAPDVLPRIFEPFFTTKEVGKGTGLGLATVFGIVQQHHGWIEVESELGQGTTFRIFLPALEKCPHAIPAGGSVPTANGGSESILLVEDETTVRTVSAAALRRHGYQVIEVRTAAEVLERWPALDGKVDLLVTDIVMPGGVSGQKLAKELQKRRPGLKVIYTTGYSGHVVRRQLKLEPGRNYLPKPYSFTDLTTIVRRRLDEP